MSDIFEQKKKKINKWSYNLSIFFINLLFIIKWKILYSKQHPIKKIFIPSPSVFFHVHSNIVIDLSTKCYLTRNHFSDKNLRVRGFFFKLLQPKIIWSELNNKLCVSITKYPWNALNDPRNYIICTRNPIHLNLALKSNNINYRKPFKCVDYCFYFLFKEGV